MARTAPPPIVAGSHDPLLDWALRESGSGLATYYDGSFDGLTRLKDRTAQAAALHIHEDDGFNSRPCATIWVRPRLFCMKSRNGSAGCCWHPVSPVSRALVI